MERRSFLFALAGLAASGTASFAQSAARADFRTLDLMGGEFALRTSQLALANSANPDIINFANEEIAEQAQVASMLWAAPGTAPLRSDRAAMLAVLQDRPRGRAFDAMYVKGQISGHRELLALNASYLQAGTNPQEQAVAQMSVPIIQRHLAILNGLRNI